MSASPVLLGADVGHAMTGQGPIKDTVLVEPMQKIAIDWVADNPGPSALHCH